MDIPAALPRVVCTVGVHGSASTWVFNVVRELVMLGAGRAATLPCYADEPAQLPAETESRHLVIKSHHGSVALDAWLAAEQARLFLSLRDPRDAALSMALRFKSPLQATVRWVANDCARVALLMGQGHMVLRYEDRFFDSPQTVARLATALGVSADAAALDDIFARYTTAQVKAFAETLPNQPAETVMMVGTFAMDKETQILAPHIGDTTSGKWRALAPPVQAEMTRFFTPFLTAFGYQD